MRRTLSAYSAQVIENASSLSRSAVRSGWDFAVSWKASATVVASRPAGLSVRAAAAVLMAPA